MLKEGTKSIYRWVHYGFTICGESQIFFKIPERTIDRKKIKKILFLPRREMLDDLISEIIVRSAWTYVKT
jgi:hypothetical protein